MERFRRYRRFFEKSLVIFGLCVSLLDQPHSAQSPDMLSLPTEVGGDDVIISGILFQISTEGAQCLGGEELFLAPAAVQIIQYLYGNFPLGVKAEGIRFLHKMLDAFTLPLLTGKPGLVYLTAFFHLLLPLRLQEQLLLQQHLKQLQLVVIIYQALQKEDKLILYLLILQ